MDERDRGFHSAVLSAVKAKVIFDVFAGHRLVFLCGVDIFSLCFLMGIARIRTADLMNDAFAVSGLRQICNSGIPFRLRQAFGIITAVLKENAFVDQFPSTARPHKSEAVCLGRSGRLFCRVGRGISLKIRKAVSVLCKRSYAVKEAGEALSIYLALICTDSNSYPTQIFFNNAIGVDADQMVAGLLKSVEIKGESVTETREEQEESSERVDLAEEKVAAIITVLKSRYPKGSILPKSFEELKFKNSDLQLSTLNKWTMIAYGQKARDYLISEGLLPANMTAADVRSQIADAKPIEERTISTDVPAGVLYQPGSEPEKIKVRLDRLFEKLDSAYPDKVIVGLNKNHKKWGETVTELYRLLGYPDNNSFLNAYGYITGTGASGMPLQICVCFSAGWPRFPSA